MRCCLKRPDGSRCEGSAAFAVALSVGGDGGRARLEEVPAGVADGGGWNPLAICSECHPVDDRMFIPMLRHMVDVLWERFGVKADADLIGIVYVPWQDPRIEQWRQAKRANSLAPIKNGAGVEVDSVRLGDLAPDELAAVGGRGGGGR